MASDGPAGVAQYWRRQNSRASRICTPRNARVLDAYQRLCSKDGGPFTEDIAHDQFGSDLPYLFEAEVAYGDAVTTLRLQDANQYLWGFLGAKRGDEIATLTLGGVEKIFVECLRLAVEKIAPTHVRVAIKQRNEGLRQLELLAMPLLTSDTGMVAIMFGSIDEVGARGPQIREMDWDQVSILTTAKAGIASPISS